MRYRPEVDGLRAVAVLSVILYHAGSSWVPGGFAGVDVFFVISGYLIASILFEEMSRGAFTWAGFYARRARRILPALLATLALTLGVGAATMLPNDLERLAAAALSALGFAANLFFWAESGYFDTEAALKPLLHIWSLAVEEQFYLLFPLLMTALTGAAPRRIALVFGALALASAGWSLHAAATDPEANFFFPFSRGWELLAGALCALVRRERLVRPAEAPALFGLFLLLGALHLLDAHRAWPGAYTLLPVLGTALVILFAESSGIAGRLLSMRPLVWVGLISYSAYLLHQPVLAFLRRELFWADGGLKLLLAAWAVLPLAWASWAWVETPFRRPGRVRRPLRLAAAATGAITLFCALALVSGGTLYRYPPGFAFLADAAEDFPDQACQFRPGRPVDLPAAPCLHLPPGAAAPQVLLFGDSHAWAVSGAVGAALADAGIGVHAAGMFNCLPVPGVTVTKFAARAACPDFVAANLAYARASGIRTLILMGRFPKALAEGPVDNGEGGVEPSDGYGYIFDSRYDVRSDPAAPSPSPAAARAAFREDALARLAALAAEFRLVLIDPTPEPGWNIPDEALRRALAAGAVQEVTTDLSVHRRRMAGTAALFDALPQDRVERVDTAAIFCAPESGRCRATQDGRPLYFDDDHLSNAGAALLAPAVVAAVQRALAAQ